MQYKSKLCINLAAALMCASLLMLNSNIMLAQPWERGLGGFQQENAFDIITSGQFDGSYQIGGTWTYGSSFNPNPPNMFLTQITADGSTAQGISYEVNGWDRDADVLELDDQLIWTSGVFNQNTGSFDLAVVSSALDGTINWTAWFGGFQPDGGTGIIATQDGNIVVSGFVESNTFGGRDGFLASIDPSGGVLWAFNYGGSGNDELWAVQESLDGSGDLLAVGYSNDPAGAGGDDFWLLAVDAGGIIQFSSLYGGDLNDRAFDLVLNSAICEPDEQLLTIVGETYSFGGINNDIMVLRTLPAANTLPQWIFAYEIYTAGSWDVAYAISDALTDLESNVVISGQTNSRPGTIDARGQGFAMELGPAGGLPLWTNTYGGSDYETLRGLSTFSDGYYSAGQTLTYGAGGGDQYVLSLDPNGDTGSRFGTECAELQFPNFVSTNAFNNFDLQQNDFPQVEGPEINVDFELELSEICSPGLAPAPPFKEPATLIRTFEQKILPGDAQ